MSIKGPRTKAIEQAEREERLAAALRENLRRRKEQARAQGAATPETDPDPEIPSQRPL